jgi:hypothetical protein
MEREAIRRQQTITVLRPDDVFLRLEGKADPTLVGILASTEHLTVGTMELRPGLALELSRLARCSADWHQLLDLCALTGTLIADQDGIYSPQEFNDRLLLGLKGTMSEAELHLIRARLDGGLRSKAERGELCLALPVGLDRDDDGRIVLCAYRPDRCPPG